MRFCFGEVFLQSNGLGESADDINEDGMSFMHKCRPGVTNLWLKLYDSNLVNWRHLEVCLSFALQTKWQLFNEEPGDAEVAINLAHGSLHHINCPTI